MGSGSKARRCRERIPDDWVPVQVPKNLEEMYTRWKDYQGQCVGWCLLCDQPIVSEDDLLPGSSTHNCAAGRALEAEHAQSAHADDAAAQSQEVCCEGNETDDPIS